MTKKYRVALGLLLSALILGSCSQGLRTITVAGNGTVTFIPDMAILTITVKNINPTLNQSLQQTKETIDNLTAACKQFNIDSNDIKTSYINTDKEYQSNNNNETKFIGYSSTQNTQVTYRNLKEFEKFTETILALKITSIQNVVFNHSKYNEFASQADLLALDDATKSAEKIAERMKIKLGKVRFITNVANNGGTYAAAVYTGEAFNKSISSGISASPGILSITTTVNTVFDIE